MTLSIAFIGFGEAGQTIARGLATEGVTGTVSQGNFKADQLDADLEARTVTLRGNARLRVDPRGAR